jgi:DNA polymerase sigma
MVISFLQRHPKIAAGHILGEENLGALLIEILELYGTRFNFDRVGIAIDEGGSYFDTHTYTLSNSNMWKRICIRDPNDPNNNIAKASHQTDNIIQVFSECYRELSNRCYMVHSKIQNGATKCDSVLDSIIGPLSYPSRQTGLINGTGIRAVAKPAQQKKSKLDRAARRALEREASKREKKGKRNAAAKDETVMVSKHDMLPTEEKSSSTITAPPSDGTKDRPIVLDDTLVPSSPSSTPRKRRASTRVLDKAAVNLRATGSISGGKQNVISID